MFINRKDTYLYMSSQIRIKLNLDDTELQRLEELRDLFNEKTNSKTIKKLLKLKVLI